MKRSFYLLIFAAALLGQVPSDSVIRAILADRIDTLHQNVGIVVGSPTKVFTSTILADMVQRGEVSLDDPVAKYLPAGVKMPQRGGKQITLIDLATHTSGLPRMPSNFAPKDIENPYADYTVANLFQFLSTYELKRDIGSQFEYSNMGVGLLGQALARRAGMGYEALVRARVTGPLKMENTRIALSPEMKSRLAQGHNEARQPTANWDLPTFAGAGALRSDERDMLTFIAAHLGYVESPLGPAMAAMTKVRRPAGNPQTEVALAWIVAKKEGREIYWQNGGTGGYRSFIGFDPKSRVGVVLLSNMSTRTGMDDIGMHLLDALGAARLALTADYAQGDRAPPQGFRPLGWRLPVCPGCRLDVHARGRPHVHPAHQPAKIRDLRRRRKGLLRQGRGRAIHLRDRRRWPRHRRNAASEWPRSEGQAGRAVGQASWPVHPLLHAE